MAALPQGDEWKEGTEDDITEIQNCYCPNCGGGKAVTAVLPTKVPMFREIIIMALRCDECNFRNSEVNFGGEIQPRGQTHTLHLTTPSDLNRQLIKSDSTTLRIPTLQFEIPPSTQRGVVSTVEGILKRCADDLERQQGDRLRLGDVDNFHRCRAVIEALRRFIGDDNNNKFEEFDIVLDDPAGNCHIENPMAPESDPHLTSVSYDRTPTQDMALGLQPSKKAVEDGSIDDFDPRHKNLVNAGGKKGVITVDDHRITSRDKKKDEEEKPGELNAALGKEEALTFQTPCPNCGSAEASTDMCVTDIPHFKEVIIMSLFCERCGYRSNEVKGGGAIPKFGTKISVQIGNADDLQREVLKSDTAGISIKELKLELGEGGMDGLYTTVEGLLRKMHSKLKEANPFGSGGDSVIKQHGTSEVGFGEVDPNHARYMNFLDRLQTLADGKGFPFTLLITDPLSNSFVGPVPKDAMELSLRAEKEDSRKCYDEYVDHGMVIEEFVRTHEQDEILGLLDMKTENYQDHQNDKPQAKPNLHDNKSYYATDIMEDLPDRLRRLDHRGPDHPHVVAKAPVENDHTIMGPGSANFAIPGMEKRGVNSTSQQAVSEEPASAQTAETNSTNFEEHIQALELKDDTFIPAEQFNASKDGMIFKKGAKGLGYYTDVPLHSMDNS